MSGGAGNDWHIVGIGDFNGDGNDDILWRNDSGVVVEWQMNGSQVLSAQAVSGAGPDWHIVGTGDFNGDGKSDILWRNDIGQVVEWQMNGSQVQSAAYVGGAGSDWHIVGVGDFNSDGNDDILWRQDSGVVVEWLLTALKCSPRSTSAGPALLGKPAGTTSIWFDDFHIALYDWPTDPTADPKHVSPLANAESKR